MFFRPMIDLPPAFGVAVKLRSRPSDGLWAPVEQFAVPERRVFLKQIHSAKVFEIVSPEQVASVCGKEGDGLITVIPQVALIIRVADCAPVMIYDQRGGALALVHAGWRGVKAGIIEKATEKLRRLPSEPRELSAFIGPAIGFEDYEVGEEFFEFFPHTTRMLRGKPHFDLYGEIERRLREIGVKRISRLPVSTYSASYLHSFRRDGKRAGRMEFWAWIYDF